MSNRIKWIDALRGYGALMVIMVHFLQALTTADFVQKGFVVSYLGNGARAVQLFFMISGYVACMTANRLVINSTKQYGRYIFKKYISIMPQYIISIFLYICLGVTTFSTLGVILNITSLHGLSPTYINSVVPYGWYIGTIWLYYIISPFLLRKINSLSRSIKLIGIGLILRIASQALAWFSSGNMQTWIDFSIFSQIVFVFIGQALYFLIEKRDTKLSNIDICLLIIIVLYITLDLDMLMKWGLLIACIMLLFSLLKNSILVNKPIIFLGKFSYEIYLLHKAAITIVFRYIVRVLPLKGVWALIVYYAMCVIISLVAAIVLNKLCQYIKRLLLNKPKALIES